jgi:hypothetical protein
MNRIALETVLSHDVNARLTGRTPALSGAGAVRLEAALCRTVASNLGLTSPLAVLMLRYEGKDLISRIRRWRAGPRLPLDDCLRFARGHVRYVSLSVGKHLTDALDVDTLVSWFPDRPHELWYAILDAKLTKRVPLAAFGMLPKTAAFSLLAGGGYDLSSTMVLDLVPKCLVSKLVRGHPAALAPLTWIADNLDGVDLEETMIELAKHGRLPQEFVMSSKTPTAFKIDVLHAAGHLARMTPDDLSTSFPNDLLRCLIKAQLAHAVTPDWLKARFEGPDLFFLLTLGGHLASLTEDWASTNLDRAYVGKALAGRSLDPDWVVANVPRADVLKCLGDLSRLSVRWLEANVHRDDLYHAVVIGGHASKLSREWFLSKLPDAHSLRGLRVYGHVRPEDRAFVMSRWSGRVLLDAMIKTGMDAGSDMTLDEIAAAYGPDAVYAALVHMDRINSEYVDDLAAVLPPEQMKDALAAKGCVDEDEFARFLSGELLLDALLESDILDQCSIEYLCDNFSGELLLRAFDAGDHIATGAVDTDCILELFCPGLAMQALEMSGTLNMLTVDQAVRAFGSSTTLLRRALLSAWETPICDPDSLIPLFGDDTDSLAAVVRETTAYARMDPDDFAKYGIRL